MKLKLVEVDFIFLAAPAGRGHGNRVTVQTGLLRGRLHVSFSIGGPAESRETLPAELVDAIKAGLEYARKHVVTRDLVEIDPEPAEDDGRD